MRPLRDELEAGQKAYDRVRRHGRGPSGFAPWMIMIPVICANMEWVTHASHASQMKMIPVVALFAVAAVLLGWAWRKLMEALHAQDLVLLRLLEEKYGEQLPWIIEQKQLAEAEALDQKLKLARLGIG